MSDFYKCAGQYNDSESMAAEYLRTYYADMEISYPVNPFQMLKDISLIYIKIDEKDDYFDALRIADTIHDYAPLYEVLFKALLRCNAELSQ